MPRSSGENPLKKFKIAVLSPSAPPVSTGGIATAHDALYQGFRRRGFDAELFTFADFGRARFHQDTDSKVHRSGSAWGLAKAIQLLGKIWFSLRELKFGLRIYQTGDVLKTFWGVRKLKLALVQFQADVVIFPDQASPAVWLQKLPGQRWIQVSHHQALRFVNQPEIGEHSLVDALAATWLEKIQLGRSDACVAPTTYMANVVRSFVSVEKPITVISNLVAEVSNPPDSAEKSAKRIFIPSGGSRFKGSEIVPELVAKILSDPRSGSEIEFFVSGDLSASQKEAIRAVAPHARIVSPGHLSHEETLANLSRSRVCVSPTWIENQSMALLEAKALGVPFAAFDVGGNREQVGPSDRVVARWNVQALASAALDLIDITSGKTDFDFHARNERALDQWSELLNRVCE